MDLLREARRAVGRGDVDEALLHLWNALEPLRLNGDTAGLQRVAALADDIAVLGDGEHAHEAARLRAALAPLIGDEAVAVGRSTTTVSESVERWIEALGGASGDGAPEAGLPPDPLPTPTGGGDEPEPQKGWVRRLGPFVWVLVVLGWILVNVVGNLLDGP